MMPNVNSASLSCYVCDEPLDAKPSSKNGEAVKGGLPAGLVMLRSEGTGFSSRGGNVVEKSSIAFQC
jgi:nitric oxide synthase-interacting protein